MKTDNKLKGRDLINIGISWKRAAICKRQVLTMLI